MRVAACVGLLSVGLLAVGCHSSGGRTPTQPASSPRAAAGPKAADKDTAPAATPASRSGDETVIAGQVVDSFNHNPRAKIEVISTASAGGAPVIQRIDTDERGFFTIMGVKQGQTYQLVARTLDGSSVLTGSTWVRPPDARVIIRVSADFNPPAAPTPPPLPGRATPPATLDSPTPIGAPRPPAQLGNPVAPPALNPAPPAAPAPPAPRSGPPAAGPAITPPPLTAPRPEDIVRDPVGRPIDPAVSVPNPWLPRNGPAAPATPRGGPELPGTPQSRNPGGVTPVPSCQLVGSHLVNFALADINGQPWEFQRDRRGRVVLLDFWGTWCSHCRVSIRKHLNELNAVYGRSGLEIVGVTYEDERSLPSFQAQVQSVRSSMAQLGIGYKILMGSGPQCPVRRQFQVQSFPTLVLLNDSGQIIWRSEGLDDQSYQELKIEIRRSLGLR